jgi:hypothetical protein
MKRQAHIADVLSAVHTWYLDILSTFPDNMDQLGPHVDAPGR